MVTRCYVNKYTTIFGKVKYILRIFRINIRQNSARSAADPLCGLPKRKTARRAGTASLIIKSVL